MKKIRLTKDVFQWGLVAAVAALAMPELAVAAAATTSADFNALVQNVAQKELIGLPYILSAVCYAGGAFMMLSGALKLKAHAENPAQEKLAPGVSRLLAGGAITSVPTLTALIQNTTQIGTTGKASYQTFGVAF